MKKIENVYKCIPFWSWNDELDEEKLCEQIEWMHKNGVGGFFMHARGGLKTEYLGEKWFSCVKACKEKAKELNMEAYVYDENGWPSGFVGGKLLEKESYHDMYVESKIGPFDKNANVSYDLEKEKLEKATCGDNCLNVYVKYATSTADILNPKVVDKFIKLTHNQYKKRDKYKLLKGFFTDEPQYYRWGVSYTKMLEKYFKKNYHENVLDRIGLLFLEKEGFREYRYKYYSALADMIENNFAKKVYGFCEKNGYKLTGHFIEETSLQFQMCCCGGVMPLYAYEHIPGIDNLGRYPANVLSVKQLGSVSAQLNKKQVITESFACCGWDVTPFELKNVAESQYVYGVNLMCQHLLPYSEYGQRKRDYPAHFSKINPWVKNGFKEFNDYFSVLGELLSNSKEILNVAVLHPIKSAYICYDKTKERGGPAVIDLDESLDKLLTLLSDSQLNFHFLDEKLLKTYGSVKGTKLCCGQREYEYLIIPKIYNIESNTDKLLKEYCKNGGKILLCDNPPEYLEGVKHGFDYLASNITIEEIIEKQEIKIDRAPNVRSSYRVDKNGKKYLYSVNVGEEEKELNIKGDFTSLEEYDILKDEYRAVNKKIKLKGKDSKILYLSDKPIKKEREIKEIILDGNYEVKNAVDNYLTLDFISYSTDGINFSEKLYCLGVFDELLKRRYKGKIYLKYNFNVKDIPSKCSVIIEKAGVKEVKINKNAVKPSKTSDLDDNMEEYDIAHFVSVGENEIMLTMDYFQSEKVYYALFGENVTESLKNCLVYDSNIEAIYLKGDFGVAGKFKNGKADNVLLGEDFFITKQNKTVNGLVESGFPFFRGEITLTKKINLTEKNCKLVFSDRFHVIEVKINGKFAGKLIFNNEIDISKYAVIGENVIEIKLVVGNRNLFGPFHTIDEEDMIVTPWTFERSGTWKNGESDIFIENYSFVKY